MKRIAIAALAMALVGVAFIGGGIGLAVAQGEDAPVQTFLGRVAEKLGIGEDELRSAIGEVEQETVDERVAEGLLTPEQGERLKERIQDGALLGPRGGHVEGPRDRSCDHVFDCIHDRAHDRAHDRDGRLMVEAAATVLGMEPEELRSELQEGSTLAQVAEDQSMPLDEFTAALLDQARGDLDELVGEGKLTEDQANAIFERLEENIDDIVEGSGCGMFRGQRGAFFGGGAPGADFEPTETNIEA